MTDWRRRAFEPDHEGAHQDTDEISRLTDELQSCERLLARYPELCVSLERKRAEIEKQLKAAKRG